MDPNTTRQPSCTTRRTFVATAGVAAIGAFILSATRKAEPAIAAAAPLARPDAVGSSSCVCAHCGSPSHTSLDPTCEAGGGARRALQMEARRRSFERAWAPR
jgi:hypothetical protein